MDYTDESFHRWQEKAIKNRWKLSKIWFGPFLGGVEIHHPDLIKDLLKSKVNCRTLFSFKSNCYTSSSKVIFCLPLCGAMAWSGL